MSVTVYNPTTGRYVTTLNVSAGTKKQVSTAAIKSKEGGQAAPLTPVASSVKVSLSAAAQAVLSGTTKLKASELFAKMQQASFSPADLSGTTLYADIASADFFPPSGVELTKTFVMADVAADPSLLTLSKTDMGIGTNDPSKFNYATVQWTAYNAAKDTWDPVSDAKLPTQFGSDGTINVDYANLPADLKNKTSLRANIRYLNYEKLINLATNKGGRKIVDLRGNNDTPFVINPAVFQRLKADLRNPDLVEAGVSKVVTQTYSARVTTSQAVTTTNDSKIMSVSGTAGDVIVWRERDSMGNWNEITDKSYNLPSVFLPDRTGSATIDLSSVPVGRTIRAEVSAPIRVSPGDDVRLFVVNGNSSTEITGFPFTSDATGQIRIVPARLAALPPGSTLRTEVSSSVLLDIMPNVALNLPFTSNGEIDPSLTVEMRARFKQLAESNKAINVTINGQTGPVALTPDDVTKLGPKVLARYPGKITINADMASLSNAENWENMRILNNYRDVSVTLNPGVPESAPTKPLLPLSTVSSKLTYQQFLGGFNLINNIGVQAQPISFGSGVYQAADTTTKMRFSGLFMNGDSCQFSMALPNGNNITLPVGPLSLPSGASPKQQAEALVDGLRTALAAAKSANASIPAATIAPVDNNELTITWAAGAAPYDPQLTFISSQRAQEGTPSFACQLTNVPPSAVESLVSYPQVTSLAVSGTSDQLLNNSDKLNKLINSGFVKSVQMIASNTGQFLMTAAQAARAIPVIEKLGVPVVSITDKRSSPTSYAPFTDAAARSLRGGIQIIGTSAELSDALKGLGSLTRANKITSVTLLGANGRQTIFDNFDPLKLSMLTARLRKGV